MKKTLLAAVLALSALTASAGADVFAQYEYNSISSAAVEEATAGAAYTGRYGTLDAVAIHRVEDTTSRKGGEIGYSNKYELERFTLRGRVAVGQYGNDPVMSIAGEVNYPLAPGMQAAFGYRYRDLRDFTDNKYYAGVDFGLSPKSAVRVAYSVIEWKEEWLSGATVGVVYKF